MSLYVYNISNNQEFMYEKTLKEITAINKLNQKKLKINLIKTTEHLSAMFTDSDAVLIFLGETSEYHRDIIRKCNNHSIPVIITQTSPTIFPDCSFSTIISDAYDTIFKIVSHYNSANLNRFCIFTFNPNCMSDKNYVTSLWQCVPNFTTNDIFGTHDTFQTEFDYFFEKRNQYDVIICPNDIIAIKLIHEIKNRDPEYLKNHYIVGFMNSILAKLYSTTITSFAYDTNDLVQAIYVIYKTLKKNNTAISSMNVQLHNKIFIGETWGDFEQKNDFNPSFRSNESFIIPNNCKSLDYSKDSDLNMLIKIEQLLLKLNLFELEILYWILCDETINKISQMLYSNPQTIHYHLNKMYSALEINTKNDFINILTPYIESDNLLTYIKKLKNSRQ